MQEGSSSTNHNIFSEQQQQQRELDTTHKKCCYLPSSKTERLVGYGKNILVRGILPLDDDFQPGPYDVVCSRSSKDNKCRPGNINLLSMLKKEGYAQRYANANGKLEKTSIVSEIIEIVRRKSPNGGFVRQEIHENFSNDEYDYDGRSEDHFCGSSGRP